MRSMIVAFDDARAFEKNGASPWGDDMPVIHDRIRDLTEGHTLITDPRTFENLSDSGDTLHHQNIVIAAGAAAIVGAQVVESIAEAYASATSDEVYVTGDANTYKTAFPTVNHVFTTQVHTTVPGSNRFFRKLKPDTWSVASEHHYRADSHNAFAYSVITYLRNHPVQRYF